MASQSEWTQLAKVGKVFSLLAIAFNDKTKELYAVLEKDTLCLMKYSFSDDLWTNIQIENAERCFGDTPRSESLERLTSTLNSDTKTIYFHNALYSWKIILDPNGNNALMFKMRHAAVDMGFAPKATIIDNELHLIGFNHHMKYNETTEKWKFVGYIKEAYIEDSDNDNEDVADEYQVKEWNIENHGMIRVNDKLLVFGGHAMDLDGDPKSYYYTNSVLEYDIPKNKWTKLNAKIPNGALMGYGAASIMNGEYVAVFGGNGVEDGGGFGTSEISIYSVKEQTFRMSKIQCPRGNEWQAISVRNKLNEEKTAYGFVRMQWNELKMDYWLPPKYILSLIAMYFWNEQVHLIETGNYWDQRGSHYKIDAIKLI